MAIAVRHILVVVIIVQSKLAVCAHLGSEWLVSIVVSLLLLFVASNSNYNSSSPVCSMSLEYCAASL